MSLASVAGSLHNQDNPNFVALITHSHYVVPGSGECRMPGEAIIIDETIKN
jgi:hypothetical protein